MKNVVVIMIVILALLLSSCEASSINDLVIKLNSGVDTVELGGEFVDAGATANFEGLDLAVVVIENNVNTNVIGVYKVVYQVEHNQFKKTITRIVTVIDETPPIISLNAGVDTIFVGRTWIDAGVTYSDLSNGEITLLSLGEVLSDVVGEYIIMYQATDESGNTAVIKRYVNVIDPA